MTGDKVKLVAADMRELFFPQPSQRMGADGRGDAFTPAVRHAAWMCDEIATLADAGRIEKAMRWLGFVQGVAWAHGLATIDELKRMNMPPEETATK